MGEERKPVAAPDQVGAIAQMVRTLRLVWRLMMDGRVSAIPKLIIPATAIYVISPIDLIPDVILGLGQLDDIGIVVLGIALFIEFCPRAIVDEHRRALAAEASPPSADAESVIDGSYRVKSDDEE